MSINGAGGNIGRGPRHGLGGTPADGLHPVRAYAHRGWHIDDLDGAENTMAAFRRAVDEGFRDLETDVQLTADGVLVLFHDDTLDRVTNARGPIAAMSSDGLREVTIRGRHQIPTLADALESLPEARWNIDPKSDAAAEALVDVIEAANAWARVSIGSFSDERLQAVRDRSPQGTRLGLGARAIRRAVVASALARPIRAEGAWALQVPVAHRHIPIVTRRFVRAAHRAALEVHVWTIDEPADMGRLLDLGVDGLMSDRPDILRRVLQARGLWDLR